MSQPRARADEVIDVNKAVSLRAKLLALAAAQRERTDWEARRLHQLMRAVDEEHAHERAAALQKAAAEDSTKFAEERAKKAVARDEAQAAATQRERAEARADVRRVLAAHDDAQAAVWLNKAQAAESEAHGKARELLLAEIGRAHV